VRRHLVILAAILAAVGGVVVLALFRSPTLGLDLQGGLEVLLQAKAPAGREVTQEDLDRSKDIMEERVNKLGVSEPEVRKEGSDQISVQLPGVHDAARAAEIVGQTAQLEFYKLQADAIAPTADPTAPPFIQPSDSLLSLLEGQQELAEKGTPTAWYLYSDKKERLAGPADTKEQIERQLGGTIPDGAKFYAVPEGRTILTCTDNARLCPGVGPPPPGRTFYYLFKYQPNNAENPIPELTGTDLKADGTRSDFRDNQPVVTLAFTDSGGDKFHEITRALAQEGLAKWNLAGGAGSEDDYNQSFAIVLDGEIRSYPSIDFNNYPDGIAGGNAEISGLQSDQEADDLALVLQTGALPVEFVQLQLQDVSATLGEDSLREALIAGIGGLAAVAFFLLLFYRFLGLIAIIGLAIYGVLLYGAILIFNVTLTLPGFAGLILTIGVAADANVVIFERIKEEVRAGKSVRAAIAGGYRKGFNTIVDANVVTAITAAVLFMAATGGVRGFALMLLIGTLLSMVTAVGATRALLGVLGGFRWFNNPAFMGASAQKIPAWQRIDFVGKTKLWFALSGTVLLVGLVSLGVQGLNLGIDFKGGSQISFKTPQPHAVEDVRTEAAGAGLAGAVIQGRGPVQNGGYTEFQLRAKSLTTTQQTDFQNAIRSDLDATSVGVKSVSASFSQTILRGALIAIVFSLLLIVIYVAWRFEFKYAVPVLTALVHDIVITLGIYSLTDREVTTSTVAAVLTILGYSIYDTIIIFDRVRENAPLMRRSSFAAIANQSLWETIRRSLATTFITLLPVASLLVFGGDTLKDFAFALLVGIGSGAYSTIFIATPLLVLLKEREPEYAKRKTAGLREKIEVVEGEEVVEEEPVAVEQEEEEEEPVAAPPAPALGGDGAQARREARRKRRRARPHGRAR
jgi:SecD/SecF fusion protein